MVEVRATVEDDQGWSLPDFPIEETSAVHAHVTRADTGP